MAKELLIQSLIFCLVILSVQVQAAIVTEEEAKTAAPASTSATIFYPINTGGPQVVVNAEVPESTRLGVSVEDDDMVFVQWSHS